MGSIPEGVWAQGSSNSGVCISSSHILIFTPSVTPSHLLTFTPSHLHICSSSHLLIFAHSHLHTCSSSNHLSHLLIFTSFAQTCPSTHLFIWRSSFTSAPLHICSSLHLLTFTSVHLEIFSHICASSHVLIFASAHLRICSSSHLLLFTPAHLHIISHICSSSHLIIFTSSFTFAPLHTFSHTFSSSHLLSFFSLFSLSPFYLSLFKPRVAPAGSHETWTLSHEMRVDRQKLRNNCDFTCVDRQNWSKIATWLVLEQPFRTKWAWIVKNWRKIVARTKRGRLPKVEENCNFTCARATFSHDMRLDRQKLK